MARERIEIKCVRCGHAWEVNLDDLEGVEQVVYRGKVVQKTYRDRCPNCHTYNVFTVEVEEA